MEIWRILQADITFWLCYEPLWRQFWFLNICQREDKWSSNESIFCPLYKGFRAWSGSGRNRSATLKACPVTALLVTRNEIVQHGEFPVGCLVPVPDHSVQTWWQILDFIFSGVLRERKSRILEGWACDSHVGICLSLSHANKLFKDPLLVILLE